MVVAVIVIASCAAAPGISTASAATRKPTACEATPVHPVGEAPPAWARARGPAGTRFVVGQGDPIVGFLFVDLAPRPRGSRAHNKILWHVKRSRAGDPLLFRAHRAGSTRVRRWSWPATAQPGKIYPSYLDVRTAGCWTVELEWGDDRAVVTFEIPTLRRT
ncbi:MAG: hypothetical protein R3C15_02020 [Thermoleophilia bacterium]